MDRPSSAWKATGFASTAATTIHWHGIMLPNGMDGVGGLTQKAIQPGETFMYEFTFWQHGIFMDHAHHDEMTQMALGLLGAFVIHPRDPKESRPDRDFVYISASGGSIPARRNRIQTR